MGLICRPNRMELIEALYTAPDIDGMARMFDVSVTMVQFWCADEKLRLPSHMKDSASSVRAIKSRLTERKSRVPGVTPRNTETFTEKQIALAFRGRRFENAPRAIRECREDHRRVR